MKVVWTPEAQEDRAGIWDRIAGDNPPAAARMDALFSAAAARLAGHPKLGRPGKIPGTRELIPHELTALCMKSKARRLGGSPSPTPPDNGRPFAPHDPRNAGVLIVAFTEPSGGAARSGA